MPEQKKIRQIFALANKLEMSDGTHGDDLHYLIYRVTGQSSVRALTEGEAASVINELQKYVELAELDKHAPSPRCDTLISDAQIKCIYGKMHRLVSYDIKPSEVSFRERLTGILSKVTGLQINSSGDMFKGLTEAQGAAVIEELKRYTRSAQIRWKKAQISDNNCGESDMGSKDNE